MIQGGHLIVLCWVTLSIIKCSSLSFAQGSRQPCPLISKEVLQDLSTRNTILVTIADSLMWSQFGPSWVSNVKRAGIDYWIVAALDFNLSMHLRSDLQMKRCVTSPAASDLNTKEDVIWGGIAWRSVTWKKTRTCQAIHNEGFNVIHSDLDVSWFRNPLEFFLDTHPKQTLLISTDAINTWNKPGDLGMEGQATPYISMNTGMYFMRQTPEARDLYVKWISMMNWRPPFGVRPTEQVGLNIIIRGKALDKNKYPDFAEPILKPDVVNRTLFFGPNFTWSVSMLATSMFAHQYSFFVERMQQLQQVPVYALHFIWGSPSWQSKTACMRDLGVYHDPPDYYTGPKLVTMELDYVKTPADFNSWTDTEAMSSFHVYALEHQLQQIFWASNVAHILGRALVLPKLQCHCYKNWFQTERCRLSGESYTQFPFTCTISQAMRPKILQANFSANGKPILLREYSILDNPSFPQELKKSRIVVETDVNLRHVPPTVNCTDLADGGKKCIIPVWMTDYYWKDLVRKMPEAHIIHLSQPGKQNVGYQNSTLQAGFANAWSKAETYWCCRHPAEKERLGVSAERTRLQIVPPLQRREHLPPGSSAATTKGN